MYLYYKNKTVSFVNQTLFGKMYMYLVSNLSTYIQIMYIFEK